MIVETEARARLAAAAEGPLVIAHRGCWGPLPENSAAAIAAAAAFDVIEIDVRLMADGTPYLIHDDTLARMIGMPLAADGLAEADRQGARLLAGAGGATATPTDHTLPTLEEALSAGGPNAIFDLDVKRAEDIPHVAAWMERHPARSRATLKVATRTPEDIGALQALEARHGITVMAKVDVEGPDQIHLLGKIARAEVAAAEIWFPEIELARAASAAGPVLTTYTLDEAHCAGLSDTRAKADPGPVWGTLLDAGIRGIMTDLPHGLAAFYASREAPKPR